MLGSHGTACTVIRKEHSEVEQHLRFVQAAPLLGNLPDACEACFWYWHIACCSGAPGQDASLHPVDLPMLGNAVPFLHPGIQKHPIPDPLPPSDHPLRGQCRLES